MESVAEVYERLDPFIRSSISRISIMESIRSRDNSSSDPPVVEAILVDDPIEKFWRDVWLAAFEQGATADEAQDTANVALEMFANRFSWRPK